MSELGVIITAPNGVLHKFIGTNPSGGVVTVVQAKREVKVYVDFVLVSTSAPAPFSLVDTPRRKAGRTASGATCTRDGCEHPRHALRLCRKHYKQQRRGTLAAACTCGRDVLPGFKHCDGCGVPVAYTGRTEVLV
jgi:hypothetical protein